MALPQRLRACSATKSSFAASENMLMVEPCTANASVRGAAYAAKVSIVAPYAAGIFCCNRNTTQFVPASNVMTPVMP
eukprot:10715935-Ditylum_brightwellii.AAC.1